jgi:hypothetical protein
MLRFLLFLDATLLVEDFMINTCNSIMVILNLKKGDICIKGIKTIVITIQTLYKY